MTPLTILCFAVGSFLAIAWLLWFWIDRTDRLYRLSPAYLAIINPPKRRSKQEPTWKVTTEGPLCVGDKKFFSCSTIGCEKNVAMVDFNMGWCIDCGEDLDKKVR